MSWLEILGVFAAGIALSAVLRRFGEPYWGHLPEVVQALIRIAIGVAIIASLALGIPPVLRRLRRRRDD
jgi:hypothetical protein